MTKVNGKEMKSYEEEFEMISKLVPLEVRLRSVYVPLMLQEICVLLARAIREGVTESAREKAKRWQPNVKDKQLKRDMRTLREMIDDYERTMMANVGNRDVVDLIKEDSMEMYADIVDQIAMSRQAYKQAIWHEGFDIDSNTAELIALCYVTKMLLRYSVEEDVRMLAELNGYLKNKKKRMHKDMPSWIPVMDHCMTAITTTYYELPKDINGPVIDTCKRVIDNKIKGMEFERYAVDEI